MWDWCPSAHLALSIKANRRIPWNSSINMFMFISEMQLVCTAELPAFVRVFRDLASCQVWLHVSSHWDVLDEYVWGSTQETSSEPTANWLGWPALTWLWHLFFVQKETRCCRYSVARLQWSTGHSGPVVLAVFYYITPKCIESILTTFLGEKTLCTSECSQFL